MEPDDDGNLVPVDHVSETIALHETPSPLPIIDPEGDAWTVEILAGTLPTDVTMNDQGVFFGTATQTGTFNITMETCDDRTPPACSTFTYTLTVEDSLPATGIETVHIGLLGLLALILGSLILVLTSRRRDEAVRADPR
jgi:LPXTG-motif cell wall-anchored protein